MKNLLFVLSTVFVILTFVGITYVLINRGTVSAGYAVVPMVMALTCSSAYKISKKKANNSKTNE